MLFSAVIRALTLRKTNDPCQAPLRRRIRRLHDLKDGHEVGNNLDASSGSARPPSQRRDRTMIFEQVATGGCQSYLIGCADTCAGALIDPETSQVDRYLGLAARDGLRIRFVIDTHTHADHFSASRRLADRLGAMTVMHRASPAPGISMRVDDGESIVLGKLRLQVLHTPGHTADSMCLVGADRVFTGDTLLIGGTGRTDLPSGDPEALYDSLFGKLLALDPALLVYPAHDYKGRSHSTLGAEIESNPRLQQRERAAFVQMMKSLDLSMPTHLTEALRTNMSGGKTVAEMLAEATACVPFMSMAELRARVESAANELVVLDVREKDAYEAGHIPGARLLPRGQLELRVDKELPDPTARIVTCCEFGRISTLAASTLRTMGFQRAVALDGGMKSWLEAGYPTRGGALP
jgi:glyoxylase-like metal-dependent hydrolase (beta-lactamase superfamily II)/rhodanese-related sulfurtransferase